MLYKILDAIAGTPWWAWVGLVYVITIGVLNLKTRVRKLPKIFILPTIFLVIFLQGLISKFGFSLYPWSIWFVALLLGFVISWFLFKNVKIQADHKNYLIKIPGSPATLILVLFVFAGKYFFGYTSAVNQSLAKGLIFINSKLIFSGSIEGIFIGRVLCYLNKYFKAENEDLAN